MQTYAPLDRSWPDHAAPPAALAPYAYKLDSGLLGIAAPQQGSLAIDEQKLTSDWVISTPLRDRGGDEMGPDVDLSEYKLIPNVLFAHRQAMPGQPGLPMPVGLSEAPDGRLMIWKDEKGWLCGRCHHHLDTSEARLCWLGVKNGWLRGASIGFDPVSQPVPLPPEPGQRRVGFRFDRWKLLEWSIVLTPMNAHCGIIRKCLELGRVEGEPITPLFRKALEFAAERPSVWAPGWDAPEEDKSFDVAAESLPPSSTTYDWVSRYLEVPIKSIWEQGEVVPRVRMGDFLLGLRHALGSRRAEADDVRNVEGRSESPPVYEVVRLDSKSQESFLVEGATFYRADFGRLVVKVRPHWGGLVVTCYTSAEHSASNAELFAKAWAWADQHNHLKGEAFSLGGEFLPRTQEGWDDVFLEEENKVSLRRTCELFNAKGAGFANRGVILTGPPGTGKTLSGRILRNQAKGTFLWVSSRDFHESGSYGGIRFGFKMARELAPSVLFVEDVDNWMGDTTVDLVKTEMDGISRSSGVLTVLTTNFPERLPAALIDRPGRFHDVLCFGLPSAKARGEMLAKWLPGLPAAQRQSAAARTEGYSGAHVYELAHFARTLNEHDGLSLADALERALAKVEQQRQLITGLQLEGSDYRPRRRSGEGEFKKSWSGLVKEFNEADHPRAADGKFGSGGGSGSAKEENKEAPKEGAASETPRSKRTVKIDETARAAAKKLFGKDLSDDDFADLACAPPGATVTVSHAGGKLYVTGASSETDESGAPLYTATRAIYKPWFAPLTCENKTFGLRGGARGQGAELFSNQVEALRRAGVARVVASAAGGPDGGGNGYYTWPRLGYGGPMSGEQIKRLPEDVRKRLGSKKDVRDLFDVEGGPEAWKAHGGGLPYVVFDLAPDSRNSKALAAYRASKSTKKEEKQWPTSQKKQTGKSTTGSSASSTNSPAPTASAARSSSSSRPKSKSSPRSSASPTTPARSIEPGSPVAAQLLKVLAPLPAILDVVRTRAGGTMSDKAFPPKKKPDEEPPDEGGEDQGLQKPPPDAQERSQSAPDLAAVIGNLTTAIVQLQEMVAPKETVADPAPPPPAQSPPGGADQADEQNAEADTSADGKPPVDDPDEERKKEEEQRRAAERYRRSGEPQHAKGWRKEHVQAVADAADHLDELAGMEPGQKWTGSHRTACRAHCAAVRKAMAESSLAAGGACEPAETGAKGEEVCALVEKSFGSIDDMIFRLTGKKVG